MWKCLKQIAELSGRRRLLCIQTPPPPTKMKGAQVRWCFATGCNERPSACNYWQVWKQIESQKICIERKSLCIPFIFTKKKFSDQRSITLYKRNKLRWWTSIIWKTDCFIFKKFGNFDKTGFMKKLLKYKFYNFREIWCNTFFYAV